MGRRQSCILAVCGGLLAIAVIACAFPILLWPRAVGRLVYIEPHERGVVLAPYEPSGEVLDPGVHLLRPGKEVQIVAISRQTYVMSAASTPGPDAIRARTNDGHDVDLDVSIVYAVDPERVLELFTGWRDQYEADLVRPVTRGTTRDIVSRYSADDLIGSKRSEAQQAVLDYVKANLAENYLIVFEFVILDVRLLD